MVKSIFKNDIIKNKYKFEMSGVYRKFIQSLTIEQIKTKFIISNNDINNVFKHSTRYANPNSYFYPKAQVDNECSMLYYLIRSGYPVTFFNDAIHYKIRPYTTHDEYLDTMITENGRLFKYEDTYSYSCLLCSTTEDMSSLTRYHHYCPENNKQRIMYGDFKYSRGLDLCSKHMGMVVILAEQTIINTYNDLFNKYRLFKHFNALDIDSINYIFNLIL